MFMFIIYALLIYIISNGIGKKFIKENSKIYSLRAVFGFAIFIGILQIGYYPIQYFHLSSNVMLIFTSIIVLFGLFIGVKTLKKEDFNFLKDYRFYLLLLFFFGIMKIVPSIDATDDEYYFPLIIDNAYNFINTINPGNGFLENIDSYHAYQGYYLFISFIYRIHHMIFNMYYDVIVCFRSTFTFLYAIYFSIILKYIVSIFKEKINKYIYLILEILSITLIGVEHLNHIYYGSFVLFSIYIPLFIIIMDYYIKHNDLKEYAIVLIEFGLLSLASSSLFLIIMILSLFISYEIIINKKIDINKYIYLLIPLIIYVIFMIDKTILILLVPLIILLLYSLSKYINNFLNKFGKYIIYSIPIILTLLSLFLGQVVNLSLFSKSILLFNLFMIISLLYLLIIKKVKINTYIFIFILCIIIYYNPLTATCVSKLFTTPYVFYRISFITKNPLIITAIFSFVISFSKNNIIKYSYQFLIILLCVIYVNNLYKLMIKNDDYSYKYNYLLRESNENLDLGEYISKLDGKIVSIDFSPRTYNPNLQISLFRFLDEEDYDDVLYKVIYKNNEVIDTFENEIINYDYIISLNNNNNLEKYYEKIFNNNTYKVFKIK